MRCSRIRTCANEELVKKTKNAPQAPSVGVRPQNASSLTVSVGSCTNTITKISLRSRAEKKKCLLIVLLYLGSSAWLVFAQWPFWALGPSNPATVPCPMSVLRTGILLVFYKTQKSIAKSPARPANTTPIFVLNNGSRKQLPLPGILLPMYVTPHSCRKASI